MLMKKAVLKILIGGLGIFLCCPIAGAATILWAGGEDIDFPNGATPQVCGSYHAGYSRYFMKSTSGSPLVSTQFAGGPVTSLWMGFYYRWQGDNTSSKPWAGLTKLGQAGHGIYLWKAVTSHYLYLTKWDGATWTTLVTGAQAVNTGVHRIDIHVQNFGAGATVDVYFDSSASPYMSYTGDVTVTGVSNMDAVGVFGDSDWGEQVVMAEFIVSDSDTRAMNLVTLAPSAAGDTNDWTGAYTDVDENALSDADTISTNADAKDAQFNLTNTPAGNFAVVAIKVAARATSTDDATVKSLKLGVKSAGTVDVDAGRSTTTSWATYERIAHTINGSALTTALLDSIQLDVRSAP